MVLPDDQAEGGKVSRESVERDGGSCLVILRSGKTGPFRGRWRLRTLKTRLTISFGSDRVYVVGRAGVHNGNSGDIVWVSGQFETNWLAVTLHKDPSGETADLGIGTKEMNAENRERRIYAVEPIRRHTG